MLKQALIILVILTILFLLYWKFWFLRQPQRIIPFDTKSIVSPADGKIVSITPFDKTINETKIEKGLLGLITTVTNDVASEGYIIGIAMNPFNVHYQRAPIEGKVTHIHYTKGIFRNALTSSLRILENEHNEILIEGKIKVKVIQIAGGLARRIKSFVHEGEPVTKGQVIGVINLGSQTVIILPKNIKLNITLNQRVQDGETIIATVS